MQRRPLVYALTVASLWLCTATLPALAALPQADLTVELRQVKEDQEDQNNPQTGTSAYIVGTANRTVTFEPQQVRVRNGEKASLQINQSMPMQWVQKVESQGATLSLPGASASQSSGGVTQAVIWMESGQSLAVTPHWPGGKQAVKLEIEMQASAVDERSSTDLPATSRQRYSTTVSAPLHQWITIATSGKAAQSGTYSSTGSGDSRRLTQIRVSNESPIAQAAPPGRTHKKTAIATVDSTAAKPNASAGATDHNAPAIKEAGK